MASLFDPVVDAYDRWYDEPEGNAIFRDEAECLRILMKGSPGRWLEIGAGTGRFAQALGVMYGIDLSLQMVLKAAQRDFRVAVARSEDLPFKRDAFDGVLISMTMCFIKDRGKAIQEARRVLPENGSLVIGMVPADSPLGKAYIKKGNEGHPLYSHAHFLTCNETVKLVESAGFIFSHGCSTLFSFPDVAKAEGPRIEAGIVPDAGFVGLFFDVHHSGV